MLPTDAASKTTMPSSKGIRLHDEDEKANSRGKCLSAVAAFPGLIVASMGQFFAACCSCTRPTHDEAEDDCETLLDGKIIPFPRHAASSFLRTGTPRRMREANHVL